MMHNFMLHTFSICWIRSRSSRWTI